MDEFEKIKTFSEGLAERQQNVAATKEATENQDIDFPQYLSTFRAVPVQEEKESRTLLWITLGLCSTIAIATVAILFPGFSETDENEIVVISPTPVPVKVLPENPGGLNIPDRDKVVYERKEVTEPVPVVENLFPEPEQPVLPTATIEPESKEEVVALPEIKEEVAEIKEQPIVEEVPEVEQPAVVEPPAEKVEEPAKIQPQETQSVEKKEVVPQSAVVWRAQLLSSSDKKKVENSWKAISKQHTALLSDMPYQIISATIPGKGTFWRLQVGEFSSKEMANNLCAKLKKKKQDCIAVK